MEYKWIYLIYMISYSPTSYSTNTCQNNAYGVTICAFRMNISKASAENICKSTRNGVLLEIFSEEMTTFVTDKLFAPEDSTKYFWIGLSRFGQNNITWDTSNRNTSQYSNWVAQPRNDCVVMQGYDGKWVSTSCDLASGYICQYQDETTMKHNDVTRAADVITTTTTENAMTSRTRLPSIGSLVSKAVASLKTTEAVTAPTTTSATTKTTEENTLQHTDLITKSSDGTLVTSAVTKGDMTTEEASAHDRSTSGLYHISDAGDCTGACEPSSTFQERLSNATVEQAELLIINGSKLTAEEIVTVQDWFLNPQYVEGTEEELHSYTMGYLKIFDGIIASSNEETFDIANPAAFADACNSILENYANKTSSNNTRLSFPNIECEVVQISTDSFDGFTSTLTSDNQDETQLQGFIGIQNDWVVDYANETDTSTMEIISVLYQTSSVEEFRTVDDNEIVSSMVSLTVLVDGKRRSVPVVFGLELDERKVNNVIDVTNTEEKDINLETICVFWDTTSEDNGFWNTYGCTRKDFNKSYVECTCNHTTNFAILMQVTEVEISQGHSAALSLLSLIGLGISTAALICTILILMWLPSLKSDRVLIHKHLVIALIIAQVLFMSTAGAVRHELICKLVAIFMHYFYLAVFVWMLIEGVHLYLEIVQVFSRFDGKSKTVYYIIGGWGFPFIIVAVSVAIRWRSYGEGQGCWLSIDDGLIWAFLGPVVVVILVNFLILLMVVRVVYRASSARGKEDAEYKHLTAALKGALFLLPLLGLSWVIGFMSVNEGTLVFQYLFVIFNSLQGFFIFLFYCAINKEVRGALSRRFSQVALESGDSKSLSLRAVAKLKSSGKSTSPVLRFTEDTSGAVSKSFDQKSDGVTTEPISASGISVHQNKSESQQNLTQKEDSKSPFSPDYD
ncbi:uncharacterized protein [Apostichopus japonicus]|uniref:uncharacterized protein n=1 Tax=Stichopus japonicus TaxID=307972 RepID=UPI003AB148F4